MKGQIYLSLTTVIFLLSVFFVRPEKTNSAACNIYIPNVFSPNGDGVNDTFLPQSNCTFQTYDFKVFDRWGSLIFQTNNETQGWNGTHRGSNAESAAYVYVLNYTMQDTTGAEVFPEKEVGTVSLVR